MKMPFTLMEIGRICGELDTTITFLRDRNLLKKQNICCNEVCSEVKSKSSDKMEFKCNICSRRFSIRSGSFFFNVHMPLQKLLLLTYIFAMKIPIRLCTALFNGDISHVTVKQWYNFLREVCSQHLLRNHTMLGGPGRVVELDESALGRKRKYYRGYVRGSGIKWIFGIIDLQTHKCHIEYVQNRARMTLFPIIRRHVAPQTQINSDEAAVYFSLQQEGYTHRTVKHKENYVNPIDGTHTNNIENFWVHLKNKIREMHGVKIEQLPLHLDEFMYRWNTKNNDPFEQILGDISQQYQL